MAAMKSRGILFIDDIHNLVPAMGAQVWGTQKGSRAPRGVQNWGNVSIYEVIEEVMEMRGRSFEIFKICASEKF